MDHGAHGTGRSRPGLSGQPPGSSGGWKYWGLMALCCLPMIAIVILLALGLWGFR